MQTPFTTLVSGSIRAQIQQIYSLTGPYTSFYGCGTQQFQNQSSHISQSIEKWLNFTLTLRYTGGGHYDHPLAKTAPIHYWVTFEGPHCGTIPIS